MSAPSAFGDNDVQILRDLEQISCTDFGEFQEALRRARTLDDRITNALNTSIPTDSFKGQVDATQRCKQLYHQLEESYRQRDNTIKRCIIVQDQVVNELREKKRNNPNDPDTLVNLRKQQTTLRIMQSEINVEEVIKDRTFKIFHERCRHAYKPSNFKL